MLKLTFDNKSSTSGVISPYKDIPEEKTSVHDEILLSAEGMLEKLSEGKHQALHDLTLLINRHIRIIYVHFDDNGIYWYHDRELGIYIPNGKAFLLKIGKSIFGHRISQGLLRAEFIPAYRTIIKNCMQDSDIWENKDYQTIGNAVILYPSLKIIPQDQNFYSKTKVNANYSVDASCPALDKWLDERFTSEKDKILLYQFLGLIIDPRNTFHKLLYIHGKSRSGKSTLNNIITTFLGGINIGHVKAQKFTEDNHITSQIYNKMVNISLDVDKREVKNLGVIKEWVGDDRTTINAKHKDAETVFKRCILLWIGNQLPQVDFTTDAFFNKVLYLYLGKSIPEQEQDSSVLNSLITPGELSGLLNKVLFHYKELLKTKIWSKVLPEEESKEYWISYSSDLVQYLVNEFEVRIGAFQYKKELYETYKVIMEEEKKLIVSAKAFFRTLRATFPELRESKKEHDDYISPVRVLINLAHK